jgi:hypothetical protein
MPSHVCRLGCGSRTLANRRLCSHQQHSHTLTVLELPTLITFFFFVNSPPIYFALLSSLLLDHNNVAKSGSAPAPGLSTSRLPHLLQTNLPAQCLDRRRPRRNRSHSEPERFCEAMEQPSRPQDSALLVRDGPASYFPPVAWECDMMMSCGRLC